ncbi:helix-turn-helix domain-containing protein [Paenibacillus eucommiae]|uniref:YesN/AraC family two-component response regulator n=1 Tax=Paenibacillus eucommiae TaxID=1355755 RepID=A0ABS4J373_9BACL|nr:AraC family transcriptional regulator [Paenibacillus eucommiae]MBP1994283.1 YesN/AraC family two-component response regulator [Paenibacillus eucommiae]
MMLKRLQILLKRNSLFFKLLTGFISLIILLLSFNFFSYTILIKDVQREIIRNNSLNLSNSVERYENHLNIIQNAIYRLYFNDKIILLNELGNSLQFDPVNQVVDEIKAITGNELLFIDNIFLQFNKNDYTIDMNGPSTTDQFSYKYFSKAYWPDFWRDQMKMTYTMKVFPESEFTNKKTNNSSRLIPVIYKNKILEQFYVAAFLNADKLMQAFHNSNQDQFYILDEDKRPIFSSSSESLSPHLLDKITGSEAYVNQDATYYFYKKGAFSNLTYVNVVPYNKLYNDMIQLNLILISLLGLALIISIIISIGLSLKFNSPVKKIINAINKLGSESPLHSNIDEYNLIYDKIKHFIQADQDIRDDFKQNAAQLQYFRYMCKMKNIYSHDKEFQDDKKPFYLILFHLTKTEAFQLLSTGEQQRAMYYIKEFIDIVLSEHFSDPVTMQIEKDQIISILITETEEKDLNAIIHRLKHVFDHDKDYCTLTVAVNPILRTSAEFTEAYDEALEMVHRRKMTNETQVITEMLPEPLITGFTPDHEQTFITYLQSGAKESCMSMITTQLNHMEKIGVSARQYEDFARNLITITIKMMLTMNLDISSILDKKSPYSHLSNCFSIQGHIDFFERFFSEAAHMISSISEDNDPIKSLLLQYVNLNYSQEISLDKVADELGLSSHYVSKYFKEKTGTNFIDYVTQLRINKAKDLLLNSSLKTQEISEQVGYMYTNSFIRMFRKATGVSPGEYRKSVRLKRNNADLTSF